MQLPKTIGLRFSNHHSPARFGNDVLSQQTLDEFKTIRDWQVDSTILQNSQMDIRTMLKADLMKESNFKHLPIKDMDPAGSFGYKVTILRTLLKCSVAYFPDTDTQTISRQGREACLVGSTNSTRPNNKHPEGEHKREWLKK